MKIKKIKFTFLAIVILTALLITVYAQNSGAGANALVGSWKVRLTPVDPPQPQFDEFMTFSPGGGIVESNNYPFFLQNLSAGPGQGSWSYAGRQSFPFTFIKFLYAPTGQAAGTLKVVGTITYSSRNDTWSGPATVSICDNQAENCFPIGTTDGQATRIVAGS